MEEPSVLDYVKSRLAFWRGAPPPIPPAAIPEVIEEEARPTGEIEIATVASSRPTPRPARKTSPIRIPYFTGLALLLALVGQAALEPPNRLSGVAAILYSLAAIGLVLGLWRNEINPAAIPERISNPDGFRIRSLPFFFGLLLALLAFALFGKGLFTSFNVSVWWVGLLCLMVALWPVNPNFSQAISRFWRFIKCPEWHLKINRWTILLIALAGVVVFFRVYRLNQVPPEMVSDHAEKLLDVADVLNGQSNVFFPRNTGREGFQMYLTAAIVLLFHTGLSFLSLKIGTVLAGLVTLPYIYLLGKELGNRYTGLSAVAFAGIAYWPNVISRIALRFALYPLFTAPTLYYLIRGLRTSNRRDFILAGLFLGLGLHGYSPFRVVPFVIVIAVALYLLHQRSSTERKKAILGLVIMALIALVVFLPLLRYALSHPDMFSYRTLTRLGSLEKPLDAPAGLIFLKNLWRALTMFAWDDGEVWVVSITHRPALNLISAGLFHLGVILILARYWRKRNWQDIFLLLSVPLSMMPSILSLAFPNENPILNRTAGAIVPVFVIIGVSLEAILAAIRRGINSPWGMRIAWLVGLGLFAWSAQQDYRLVFQTYQKEYMLSAWNTSEMGQVIKSFTASIGTPDSAWVVAYPYWVDTRLVGMNAGFPNKDYAIWPDHFQDTLSNPNAKLFLINPEDTQSMAMLPQLYPLGSFKEYTSRVEGKNFWIFFVPGLDSSP